MLLMGCKWGVKIVFCAHLWVCICGAGELQAHVCVSRCVLRSSRWAAGSQVLFFFQTADIGLRLPQFCCLFFSTNKTCRWEKTWKRWHALGCKRVKQQLFCIIHSRMRDNPFPTLTCLRYVALMLALKIFCVMDKNIKHCFENKFQLVENSSSEGKKKSTRQQSFTFDYGMISLFS